MGKVDIFSTNTLGRFLNQCSMPFPEADTLQKTRVAVLRFGHEMEDASIFLGDYFHCIILYIPIWQLLELLDSIDL